MFIEKRVSEFLDELASKEPVPGGGSGAALGASLAAALVSMVCNLTIGKKGYEEVSEELAGLLERSEALRRQAADLLQADTEVYSQVMAAYRLPRKTDEQKLARQEAMQSALKAAAEVPLQLAECCAEIVCAALPVAEMGNPWAVSDAGVGALLAEACLRAALLNVYVNLSSIQDEAYAQAVRGRIAAITADASDVKAQVLAIVHAKIGAA
ncbi:MAG: cyclodeaminase/cyclohydrolase family protein [Anaerolineae bacterium]|nr:cyclodeaminase/cyclohydrolase family protein [Anaerolineae bacterium]